MADHALLVNHATAKIGGGSADGDWKIDWSTATPRYTGTGKLDAVSQSGWQCLQIS